MYGGEVLPELKPFLEKSLGLDLKYKIDYKFDIRLPPPKIVHEFLQELGEKDFSRRSFEDKERLHHSHG